VSKETIAIRKKLGKRGRWAQVGKSIEKEISYPRKQNLKEGTFVGRKWCCKRFLA